jgi:chemotaxis protein histidine kinase CheA
MISLNRERLLEFYGVIQAAGSQGLVSAKLTKSLEDIRETLFLSVEAIFRQLSLGIETLAIDLGKAKPRVEIHTPKVWATDQGHEVLRNSFVHLIRNSMDHGIETPDERMKRGKIPEGTITIETTVREDWLDIQISDDGCGLNLNKIATIGIQRGLIPQGQVWGDEAVAALIFAADVSTAVAVTDISGRGVGMTAVAQYVQEVGGSIHVEFLSQAKDINGCRPFAFLLSLPLSLFQAEPRNVLQAAGY